MGVFILLTTGMCHTAWIQQTKALNILLNKFPSDNLRRLPLLQLLFSAKISSKNMPTVNAQVVRY